MTKKEFWKKIKKNRWFCSDIPCDINICPYKENHNKFCKFINNTSFGGNANNNFKLGYIEYKKELIKKICE